MSALREMLAFFGVEVDHKQLEHADERMKGLAETAEKVAATIGIAFGLHEISEFITKQIELGAELLHTSEILGLSVGDLQAFQYAAANAGLGADEANTALRFLNKNIGEAVKGAGTAGPTFQKFGVKLKDSAGEIRPTQDVLADVADGISKLHGPAEKTAAAMEIFGRAGAKMIPLLNKGAKGIDELYKEFEELGGGLSEEFVEAAEKGEHELIKLRTVSKNLVGTIAAELMPAFTAMVSWVTDAVNGFREFAEHSYIVQTALGMLAAASVVLAVIWGIMNIEILLVVAAIALAILIIDDIYTAFKGGKSVIGDFVDSIFGIGTTKKVFDDLKEWAADAYAFLKKLVDIRNDLTGHAADKEGPARTQEEMTAARKKMTDSFKARGASAEEMAMLEDQWDRAQTIGAPTKDEKAQEDQARGGRIAPVGDWGDRFAKAIVTPPAGHETDHQKAIVTPPAGAQTVQHGDVTQHNEIHVENHGGASGSEDGKQIGLAIVKELNDDHQSAFAALPTGGGH